MCIRERRDVTWRGGERVLVRGGDGTKHFPDVLSAHRDGSVTSWAVRAPEERDDTCMVMSTRTRAACAKVGWRYELFGGLDPVASLNLRWIASARRAPEWLTPAKAILQGVLADGGGCVGDVIEADDDRGFLTSAMWHLVWSGEIEMDLNAPWDQRSRLAWATDEVRT